MLSRLLVKPKASSEAEKPFWISYADLMTAMMMLFLAVMAVTILAIAREAQRVLSADEVRANEIRQICRDIKSSLADERNIYVDCVDNRISFGEVGTFAYNDYHLPAEAGPTLAALVPEVLRAANGELGRKWLKQIVIEGYTDRVGSYLSNLHLSLQRSEWVMCLMVDPAKNAALQLTEEQTAQVRELFLAGGVSFNGLKDTEAESRRVELRLQFYGLKEQLGASRLQFSATMAERCKL